ncbi:hypothetical protein KYC5002_02910 [Archangium violaceum]|uniref:hypothetical protein n=1 Tax=Archangium violaceum TaxID=83451 RepID=UPI002B30491B|nr:hypothetical protein KYC5002_02910 [Archangium gephyra]
MRHRLLVFILLAALLGGCLPRPQIHHFITQPRVACPGDQVTLNWETNGPVRIEADPPVAKLGRKSSSGKQTVAISGPTRFQLETSRVFGLRKESTRNDVGSPPIERPYGAIAAEGKDHFTCSAQTGTLETSFELESNQISSNVSVGQVLNWNVRPVLISKGGVSELVAGFAKAPGFEGQPAQGRWQLRVPLAEDESCEDALDSLSDRLIIQLQLSCPR